MRILLDTNALIWWLEDEPMLGPKARDLLANPAHTVLATVVSIWEITLKWRIGKYPKPGSAFVTFLENQDFALLGISAGHLKAFEHLEMYHKDPFDHLIIAQAIVEDATIITSDQIFTEYDVKCFPAGR